MNDLVITPENIDSIRISYTPDADAPFAIKNFASIAVITTGGQYINVGLQEVLTYIKMLELKAAIINDGSVVVALQGDNIGGKVEKFTVIKLGAPSPISSPFNVTVVTPDGLHDADFSNVINVNSVTTNVLHCGGGVAVVSFLLPKINGDFFFNDYFQSGAGVGGSFITGLDVGANWLVFLTVLAPSGTVTIGALPLNNNVIIFARDSNPGFQINSITLVGKTLQNVGTTPQGYVDESGSVFPALNIPILLKQAASFRVQNLNGGLGILNGSMNVSVSASSGTDVGVIAFGKSVQSTTQSVGTTGDYDIDFIYEPTDEGFVFIMIGNPASSVTPPPPVGVAVTSIAQAAPSTGICTGTTATYYTNDGTITTGKTVYTDIGLLTPLAGADFIVGTDGLVYEIDNVTGVVGVASGSSCTPRLAKNVFVVNNSGQPIVITTSQGTQSFAPAMNGNIGVAATDTVINDSITTRTFKFMQSLPSTIDPDVSLPNPITVAGGGTTIKVLSADISNLNYIIVT